VEQCIDTFCRVVYCLRIFRNTLKTDIADHLKDFIFTSVPATVTKVFYWKTEACQYLEEVMVQQEKPCHLKIF